MSDVLSSRSWFRVSHASFLTLHVPAPPYHVVQSNLVLPSQPDPFEPIPLGRCQFLSGTNSSAHTSYRLQTILSKPGVGRLTNVEQQREPRRTTSGSIVKSRQAKAVYLNHREDKIRRDNRRREKHEFSANSCKTRDSSWNANREFYLPFAVYGSRKLSNVRV